LTNIHKTDYKHFAIGAQTSALHFIPKLRQNAMADARTFKCANVLKICAIAKFSAGVYRR